MPETIQIYTDGSAHYKTQYGAWAFIAVHPDGMEEPHSKAYEGVTNNKMELMAVLEAIDWIIKRTPSERQGPIPDYHIISDSEYVVNGVNTWRFSWKAKGWKNVKNLPLWLAMDTVLGTIRDLGIVLRVTWVRGHDGNKYNEKCDKIAHGEYRKLAQEKGANEI